MRRRPGYLSVKEAAVCYEVSRAKIHRLIQLGRLGTAKDPRDERVTLLRSDELESLFGFPHEEAREMRYETETEGGEIIAGRLTEETCARMDAVRMRIAARYAVQGDSVEIIRQGRERRTRQIMEAISGKWEDLAEDEVNDDSS